MGGKFEWTVSSRAVFFLSDQDAEKKFSHMGFDIGVVHFFCGQG
jgi:hypothetical protein